MTCCGLYYVSLISMLETWFHGLVLCTFQIKCHCDLRGYWSLELNFLDKKLAIQGSQDTIPISHFVGDIPFLSIIFLVNFFKNLSLTIETCVDGKY